MGVGISWQPTSNSWKSVTPGARSAFLESLRRLFGDGWEWILTGEHYGALDAAAKVAEGDTAESFRALADAVYEFGEIRVRAQP